MNTILFACFFLLIMLYNCRLIHIIYFLVGVIFLFVSQEIFVNLSTVDDSLYFMCNIEDFKFLADMIQHVPLALRARYVFCCAPINKKMPFVCTMFLKVSHSPNNNFLTQLNCYFSLRDNIVEMNKSHLIGFVEIQDGLCNHQRILQILCIQKQYLMFLIFICGSGKIFTELLLLYSGINI